LIYYRRHVIETNSIGSIVISAYIYIYICANVGDDTPQLHNLALNLTTQIGFTGAVNTFPDRWEAIVRPMNGSISRTYSHQSPRFPGDLCDPW